MKKVLVLTAVSEAATGSALLIVPSLVGQLLFGTELTGIAITVARVTGILLMALDTRFPAGMTNSFALVNKDGRWSMGTIKNYKNFR
jgi:hypothetical protein